MVNSSLRFIRGPSLFSGDRNLTFWSDLSAGRLDPLMVALGPLMVVLDRLMVVLDPLMLIVLNVRGLLVVQGWSLTGPDTAAVC